MNDSQSLPGVASTYKSLPDHVVKICHAVGAPPRLTAHLTLVHDTAWHLIREMRATFPALAFKQDEVLFGASTHDIGKAIHPAELVGPGKFHERDGADLLRKFNIPEQLVRFTSTHAIWNEDPDIKIEDLLVALADNCWKGKRVPELEARVVACIAGITGKEPWEVFSTLDDILQRLAADADARLAWQAQFPSA